MHFNTFRIMKKTVAYILVLLMAATAVFAQNKERRKSIKSWENYEITTEKVGTEGTKFVKVLRTRRSLPEVCEYDD